MSIHTEVKMEAYVKIFCGVCYISIIFWLSVGVSDVPGNQIGLVSRASE